MITGFFPGTYYAAIRVVQNLPIRSSFYKIPVIAAGQLVNWVCRADVSVDFPFFSSQELIPCCGTRSPKSPLHFCKSQPCFSSPICDRGRKMKWHFIWTLPDAHSLCFLLLSSLMERYFGNSSSFTKVPCSFHHCYQARGYRACRVCSACPLLAPRAGYALPLQACVATSVRKLNYPSTISSSLLCAMKGAFHVWFVARNMSKQQDGVLSWYPR